MHVARSLSHWLEKHSLIGHSVRRLSLLKAVQSLLDGGKLSLTHLGRRREGNAHVKHQIKAVDRLLGNPHLHAERQGLYKAMAKSLMTGIRKPVLLVDWADFELRREWLMLKAAMPVKGRAITVFEKAFPFSRYNSPGAHREFLRELKAVLPEGCCPVLVTDAGFRGPWFREVASHGWDWLGRIRNGIKYYNQRTGRWCNVDSLDKLATPTIRHLGKLSLSKRKKYEFRLYLVRSQTNKMPFKRRRSTKKAKQNVPQYRRLHRAPWLLATSLPHHKHAGRQIKRLYTQRMQVEETFRDMKNHRWGFGLRYARSNDGKRLEILLLISTLASLMLWLCGLHARHTGQERYFQANTERGKPVLSLIFLGQQLLLRAEHLPTPPELRDAFKQLKILIQNAAQPPDFVGIS